jgi:folate-binding protein YgfZ
MLSPAPPPFKDGSGARSGALPGFSLLGCSGPDAGAFLQAQLMNDLRALAPGRWQWNGWLSAKGRLLCLFALWQRAEQDFLLILPDFPAAQLQPLLQRFVFRSKLKLATEEAFELRGEIGGEPGTGARDEAIAEGAGWRFDFGGEGTARQLRLVARGDGEPGDGPGFEAAWREADLRHGLPRLDASQREAWTPQMLSLQRMQAFSLSKGCYPGQEIVARTHYLGQAKRELVLLEGSGLAPGAGIADAAGNSLGTVVSVAREGGLALAVLQAGREPGTHRAGEALAREITLQGGLQRPA